MNNKTIILVEDDSTLGYILSEYLELNHFQVVWARSGKEGLEKLRKLPFSLCILDVMMPEMDGFEVARKMRDLDIKVPIIFLTAKSLKIDKLKGFNLGADDYITKPVDEEELVARIRAVLRRSGSVGASAIQDESIYLIGKYEFDFTSRRLSISGDGVIMTEKEAQLLEMLVRRKNHLLLRSDALKQIWGNNDYFTRKSMDVHIHKVRKLLAKDPSVNITNVHGKGFILNDPE